MELTNIFWFEDTDRDMKNPIKQTRYNVYYVHHKYDTRGFQIYLNSSYSYCFSTKEVAPM